MKLAQKLVISDDPIRDCGSCAFLNCMTHSLGSKQTLSEKKISREKFVCKQDGEWSGVGGLVKGKIKDIEWEH